MDSIKIDIDEMIEKLEAMKEEDFVTCRLTIQNGDYLNELQVEAVGIDEEDVTSYGSLDEVIREF